MTMKKLYLIIFILLLSANLIAQSFFQSANPYIKSYSINNYEASPQNWAIIQDNRGIMYFGNTSGLLEFDGTRWRLLKTSNNSIVRSLAKDEEGTIYVGASGEFGYLSANKKGELNYVSLVNKIDSSYTNFTNVWKTFATPYGIYFCTGDKMFRYHNDSISVIEIKLTPNIGFVINNELFIVQRDGLYLVKGNELILLPETETFWDNYAEYSVIKYQEDKILFISSRGGLWTYDYPSLQLTDNKLVKKTESDTLLSKIEFEDINYLTKNRVYAVEQIDENSYAIATNKGGIVIIDKDGSILKVLNKQTGLPDNKIWNIYVDNSKNLWAATNKGISFIEISSPIRKYDIFSGIEETVFSVAEHNGRIIAGTISKVFYLEKNKINRNNYEFKFKPFENSNSSSWNFFEINNELFSVGSSGIEKINEINTEIVYSTQKAYSFGFMDIFPDLIFIGRRKGLIILEISTNNNITKFTHKQTIDDVKNVRKIVSKENQLWLTTSYSGLICIEFSNNNFSDYKIHNFDTLSGLPSMKYNFVNLPNNKLVLATEEGIYQSIFSDSIKDTKFISDSLINQQFSFGEVENIIEIKNNYYLLARGIVGKLSKTKGGNTHKWDNFACRRIESAYQIFPLSEKYIWISTRDDGLCLFDTEKEKNYNKKYNAIIRRVSINRDSMIFNGTFFTSDSTVFTHTQTNNFVPILDYENNSVKFEFSAAFYEASEKTQYKYFLEGFSQDSSEWTTQANTIFTNLHEGTYTFKVKAANVFGIESEFAEFKFKILPPWYRTIYAYLIYFIILILVFYIFMKLYTRKLLRDKNKLEETVKERTIELSTKNIELEQHKEEIQAQTEELLVTTETLEKQNNRLGFQHKQITASVRYARTIQKASLPFEERINNYLNLFILFRPKDIVSGDFYWFTNVENITLIAAVDCTGHGVPGAFMSLIGTQLLNKIVSEDKITSPAEILLELHKGIIHALKQEKTDNSDGMDVCFCKIEKQEENKTKITFSGAKRPLYYFENNKNKFTKIKGDRKIIGGKKIGVNTISKFTDTEIILQKNDLIYLTTDGYIDQNNKERKRFGSKRLEFTINNIANKTLTEQKQTLETELDNWQGTEEQRDDITIIGIKL